MDRIASIRRINDCTSFKLNSCFSTSSTNSMTKRRFSLSTNELRPRHLPSQSTLIILYNHDTTVEILASDSESAVSSCLTDSRYSYNRINRSLPYCLVVPITLQNQGLRGIKRFNRFVLCKTNNHNEQLDIQFYHFTVISFHILIQNFLK